MNKQTKILEEDELLCLQKIFLLLSIGISESLEKQIISDEESQFFLYSPDAVMLLENIRANEKLQELTTRGLYIEDFEALGLDKNLEIQKLSKQAIEILKSMPQIKNEEGSWLQYLEFNKKHFDGYNNAWHMLNWESQVQIRLSKYNPLFRDAKGMYHKDEWQGLWQLGKKFDGKTFTDDQYIQTENTYVSTILSILETLQVNELVMAELFTPYILEPLLQGAAPLNDLIKKEIQNKFPYDTLNQSSIDLVSRIEIYKNQCISKEKFSDTLKLYLRGIIQGPLISRCNTYIHFGHDYCVYIGAEKKPTNFTSDIPKEMFIEYWPASSGWPKKINP